MKYGIGERCRVVRNALSPACTGHVVEIRGCFSVKGKNYYIIDIDGLRGYAAEDCLESLNNNKV